MKRWIRSLATILAAALVGAFLFLHAGNFLVVEDRFETAELAVVLSGAASLRVLAARDLYRQGRVERILIIPDPKGSADEELVKLGLIDPNLPPISERILVASGIPREKIRFLPNPLDGTVAEARGVHRYLRQAVPKSLVVITSKFASRRGRTIFRWVFLRQPVEVFSFPTPYDSFQPGRWWAKPRDALNVAMEYPKLLVNLLVFFLESFREGA